jgi:hypothetical protein
VLVVGLLEPGIGEGGIAHRPEGAVYVALESAPRTKAC